MATAGKLKDDFLTCNICMEVFTQPSTLSCQHTFCQGCLTSYIKTQTDAIKTRFIPCPTCRQQTPVPQPDRPVEEWAGQMKPGLLVTGLMDSLVMGNTEHCFMCKEEGETTSATHWCSECEASFCDGCLKLHRKFPSSRHHETITLSEETLRTQLRKKKYVCLEHNKTIKLFCRDCNKPLCTICCSIGHRSCKNVVTLQTMLPEVKQDLQNRQMKLTEDINNKSKKVAEDQNTIKTVLAKTSEIRLEIKQVVKRVVDLLNQKESELMKKLDDITEQQTGQLQATVKSGEMEIQMYKQQAQFIQQTLKLEDEAQLYRIYLSGLGAVADVTKIPDNGRDETNISFIHDLEKLKEAIDKMDVKTVDDVIDLTALPGLNEVIDAKVDQNDRCDLRDVVVMKMNDMEVTVVTDFNKCRVKSFYRKCGQQLSSQLKVDKFPWSVSVLIQNKVVVSVPRSNQIITIGVNPDLELLTTITTEKQYRGLAVLDQSTLVASTDSPASVDVLDMTGRVVRTISTHPSIQQPFKKPYYLHVTSQGNILVSDCGLGSVSCLTPTGQVVFTYKPTGNRELKEPHGITSTTEGDIVFTDWTADKVIHISKSGQFIKDILTSQDGLKYPIGLCIDGDTLCVATRYRGLELFQFSSK